MSARMKKPHIHKKTQPRVIGKGVFRKRFQFQTIKTGVLSEVKIKLPMKKVRFFYVPNSIVLNIISTVKDYEKKESTNWRDVFSKEIEKIGESALALKDARVRENMTQKKLANLLGTSQVYISQLENGRKEINKQTAKKLEKIFNINYKVFL